MKLIKILQIIISSPIWLALLIAIHASKNRSLIEGDLARYPKRMGGGISLILNFIYLEPAFRSVLYYRLPPLLGNFFRFFFADNRTLHIGTPNIGAGLLVVHGDATFLSAKSIGKNLYVNQCVTIGVVGDKAPIIGDNVRVATGAIVIGGITIGNNVIIGAGSVVVKNVPDNCTVVGNPARIVKLNGEKVDIPL